MSQFDKPAEHITFAMVKPTCCECREKPTTKILSFPFQSAVKTPQGPAILLTQTKVLMGLCEDCGRDMKYTAGMASLLYDEFTGDDVTKAIAWVESQNQKG